MVPTAAVMLAAAALGMTHSDAPVVLSIAGSDSGGGAGIQADLKTCEALGAFGTTAIVALTAQNTKGVQAAEAMSTELVTQQIDSVLGDMGAHAIKTGMLPTTEIIDAVATALDKHGASIRVIDPVFVAASGDVLVGPEALAALKSRLVPTATVLTPNMPEAGTLLGRAAPATVDEMRVAAGDLLDLGAQSVLLKGGRLAAGEMIDVYADRDAKGGVRLVELKYDRVETTNTHGAGCTLAAAVAAELAKQRHASTGDLDVLAAVRAARAYLGSVFGVSAKLRIGEGGRGPLNHAHAAWAPAVGKGTAADGALSNGASKGPLSQQMWTSPNVVALAEASLTNGFVKALAAATLPKSNFASYVAQVRSPTSRRISPHLHMAIRSPNPIVCAPHGPF